MPSSAARKARRQAALPAEPDAQAREPDEGAAKPSAKRKTSSAVVAAELPEKKRAKKSAGDKKRRPADDEATSSPADADVKASAWDEPDDDEAAGRGGLRWHKD